MCMCALIQSSPTVIPSYEMYIIASVLCGFCWKPVYLLSFFEDVIRLFTDVITIFLVCTCLV